MHVYVCVYVKEKERIEKISRCKGYHWRRQWQPTPVLLPGKSHGRRSLVGCSPWGCKESDTTEWLHFHALEKEMATSSSDLAWRIPGMGEPGGLPSLGLHRVGHDWSDLAAAAAAVHTRRFEGESWFGGFWGLFSGRMLWVNTVALSSRMLCFWVLCIFGCLILSALQKFWGCPRVICNVQIYIFWMMNCI